MKFVYVYISSFAECQFATFLPDSVVCLMLHMYSMHVKGCSTGCSCVSVNRIISELTVLLPDKPETKRRYPVKT